jgi:hypothetical protein
MIKQSTQRKTNVLDPKLMQDLALDRQRAMIEWRAQQRLLNRLPKQESAFKGLVKSIINKLEAINQPHAEEQPRAERKRREA